MNIVENRHEFCKKKCKAFCKKKRHGFWIGCEPISWFLEEPLVLALSGVSPSVQEPRLLQEDQADQPARRSQDLPDGSSACVLGCWMNSFTMQKKRSVWEDQLSYLCTGLAKTSLSCGSLFSGEALVSLENTFSKQNIDVEIGKILQRQLSLLLIKM